MPKRQPKIASGRRASLQATALPVGATPPERLDAPRRGGNHGGVRRSKTKHTSIGARNHNRETLVQSRCPLCRKLDLIERGKDRLETKLRLAPRSRLGFHAAPRAQIAKAYTAYLVRLKAHPSCAACGIKVGPGHITHSPVKERGMLFCPTCPKVTGAEWRRRHGMSGLLEQNEG